MIQPQIKTHRLADPIATCGDRVYIIGSQNGLFPDSPGGHVPQEMWGVWDHPIKLLDGYWFGLTASPADPPQWLIEADECRAYAGYTEFAYRFGSLRIIRRDFVPNGLEGFTVTLTLSNDSAGDMPVTLHALFRSDLRPAWLGEPAGLHDSKDVSEVTPEGVCIFSDTQNPWTCVVGAAQSMSQAAINTGDELWAAQRTSGVGTSAHFTLSFTVAGRQQATVTFFIAGSSTSREAALHTFDQLRAEHVELLAAKTAQCQRIVETSAVNTPDERLNMAIAWSKLTNQMFMRNVPPHGAGVGAGLPEYPWWFGIDSEYAVLPMLQSGQFELVRDTLQLLMRQSLKTNRTEPGRVLHEMSTTGVVYNDGNQVETVAFTRAVHQYWLWSGDHRFLDETYTFCKQGVLDYALGACDADGDLCPSGRSIIETLEMAAGFEVIDVAAYTWDALVRLAELAEVVGDASTAEAARSKAVVLANRIRTEWWLADEGLFADVRASIAEVEQVLSQLDASVAQHSQQPEQQRQAAVARQLFQPYLLKYKDRPRNIDLPWLLRHWVVFCPAEVGAATPQQTAQLLQRLMSPEFRGEWGMYLHPEQRNAMSINTGMLALTAARYGDIPVAMQMMRPLIDAFSCRTPGAICEALPDQWCFTQLWSNVGVVSPVVECFLGIEPRAAERRLRVTPNLPAEWGWVDVKALRVGDAAFDIRAEHTHEGYAISVSGPTDWTIEAGAVLPDGATPKSVLVNDQPVDWQIVETNSGRCVRCRVQGDCRLTIVL